MRVLKLARSIRVGNSYVGYSFFVALGILKNVRHFSWEGKTRIDLIKTFAAWILDDKARCATLCSADAVACCISAEPDGTCAMHPVSVEHPLQECRHKVAGHYSTDLAGAAHEAAGMQAFYDT